MLLLLPALETVDDEEEPGGGGFEFFRRCLLLLPTPPPPPVAPGDGEGEEGCKMSGERLHHFDFGCEFFTRPIRVN